MTTTMAAATVMAAAVVSMVSVVVMMMIPIIIFIIYVDTPVPAWTRPYWIAVVFIIVIIPLIAGIDIYLNRSIGHAKERSNSDHEKNCHFSHSYL